MRYLLLLILLLLSNAVILGLPVNTPSPGTINSHASGKVAVASASESIREVYRDAFVVAVKDSYALQVGAFRNRSNAEKILNKLKSLSGIKVRIFTEGGLYKVRITQFPELNERPADVEQLTQQVKLRASPETGRDKVSREPESSPRFYRTSLRMPCPGAPDYTSDFMGYSVSAGEDTLIPGTAAGPDSLSSGTRQQGKPRQSEITEDTSSAVIKSNIPGRESPWLKRIRYFGESFALVNALIVTILSSIGAMITMLIIILLNRRKMENEERMHQYLMEKYQSLIVDYLYGSATPDQFRSIASDNYSRQVLIDQMIDVSVNLKGEESKKLFSLYKHLGLDKDSLARAHDYRWHKKIKGFRELAFMNIRDANESMYKALNSSNEILRMEAQIALVRLNSEEHFDFLFHLKRPFSLWEQITLHDLIIQHEIPIPSFKKYLGSPNDTVVIFALRMIREFRQMDAEEGIKNSLHHKSQEVRLLAVQVAGDLGLTSTLEIMKRIYKYQDYKASLEIVRSMGKMPDVSMLSFLKLVLDKEDDVQLQIEATKSIEKMGEEGVKALVKIMKSEYKNYNIIVRHVLDRRIN